MHDSCPGLLLLVADKSQVCTPFTPQLAVIMLRAAELLCNIFFSAASPGLQASQTLSHRSLGCLDPQCVLCEHNPHRRCNVNFAPKYLVNDVLKAKCEAPIRVEIIDRATGVPLGEDIPDVHLEVRL